MSAPGSPENSSLAHYYDWELTGRRVRIYLDAAMAGRLQAQVLQGLESPGGAREIGGILLGHVEDAAETTCPFIEDFVPVPCSYADGPFYSLSGQDVLQFESALLRAALDGCDSQSRQVVGYFRSHTRNTLSLAAADLSLIESYFTEPSSVFMLVEVATGAKACTAGFFVWEDGRINSECSSLKAALGPAPDAETSVNPGVSPPPPRAPWRGLVLRLAVIILSTAALVISAIRYLSAPRQTREDVAASANATGLLGLQVESDSGDSGGLVLTWNPAAPEIARAVRGVLSILDGPAEKRLLLDKLQLSSGSVLYTPTGSDIKFRLEVYDARQRASAQILRVLRPAVSPQTTP